MQQVEVGFEIVRKGDVLECPVAHFCFRIVQHSAKGIVHLQPAAVETDHRDAVRGAHQRHAEALVAFLVQRIGRTVLHEPRHRIAVASGTEDADSHRVVAKREACRCRVTLSAGLQPAAELLHGRREILAQGEELPRNVPSIENGRVQIEFSADEIAAPAADRKRLGERSRQRSGHRAGRRVGDGLWIGQAHGTFQFQTNPDTAASGLSAIVSRGGLTIGFLSKNARFPGRTGGRFGTSRPDG